jgi:hypothetical protein
MSGVFVAGGTMKPGTLTYIERNADTELFEAVIAGQYCSVLTTRQMGKSSLMARTAARLREQHIACATIDLQGKNGQPEQWYYGFLKQLVDGLGLSIDLARWWKDQELLPPAQRVTDFFADVVLKQIAGPVVVFVDEVDWMIRLPFSDEFFAAIRSCFNRRATEPVFERLTFVLLGSASPAQLIKDATRTPFNIGRGIELTDFTPAEAKPLAQWLGDDGDRILARILYWTDGHPYLTQMLCEQAAQTTFDDQPADAAVDSIVHEKLLSTSARQQENNLKFVADRLTQGTRNLRRVLRTYRDVLCGEPVPDIPASPVHTSLRLSGAVKTNADRLLTVRNRVYQTVFNERWIREKTPLDLRLVLAAASAAMLVAIFAVWYLYLFPQPYIQALQTAYKDTEVAYQAYDHLNYPFHRAEANELLAQFFERRNDRDSAIMVRARAGDLVGLSELIGTNYLYLQRTFRYPGPVATGSGNYARLYDIDGRREVSHFAHDSDSGLFGVAFSPDGKLLATASGIPGGKGKARIFELATRRETFNFSYEANVMGVAFSPDGKLLAVASYDGIVRLIALGTQREVLRLHQPAGVQSVRFSADGKLVATGSNESTARVFDVASGREISRLACEEGIVLRVAFTLDRKQVAAACPDDNTARLFQAFIGREPPPRAEAVSFSAVSSAAATLPDEIARLAELQTSDKGKSFRYSPDKNLLVTRTGNWLHLYQRSRHQWIPIANRHLPALWPNTLRFLADPHCPRCVQVDRDVPENARKTEIVNFDAHPSPTIHGTPQQLVAEWGSKLALKFDSRGRIVSATPPLRSVK